MRLLPRRRPSLPADVQSLLSLEPGERVLAWSPLAVAGHVALTPGRIVVLTAQGTTIARPWVQVDHLSWDADSRTLAVFWVGTRQVQGLELPLDSYVPEVAHERWRSSVVLSRQVGLAGGRSAWLALRRDIDGTVSTQVNLPRGVRRDDPGVSEAITRGAAALREEAGLDPGSGPTEVIWGFR